MAVEAKPGVSLATTVADRIRRQIASGELEVGTRFAPEPELAEEYGVSRATLREALKSLEREGLILRRQRAGTTIMARPALAHPLQRNGSVRELIEASGRSHRVQEAQLRFLEAPAEVAATLELKAGRPVVELERVRTADGAPVVLTIDHLDARLVERATAPLLPEVPLYAWLAEHCAVEVTYGVANLSAILASNRIATKLAVADGTPLLRLVQTDFTASGRPVLRSEELHVAEAFDITVVRNGPFGAR
jgi:GntR family transcriptional regulator